MTKTIAAIRKAMARLRRRDRSDDAFGAIYAVVKNSGLFDFDFYLATYPDVASSGMDPLRHYLLHGEGEGRNPSADFDTMDYFAANPDVAEAGLNALYHYVAHGRDEGRRLALPTARGQPPVTAPKMVPLVPVAQPIAQADPGTLPHSAAAIREELDRAGVFDAAFYLVANPDVAAARIDPLEHFISSGATEGRLANTIFDAHWYTQHYCAPGANALFALWHYVHEGARKSFDPAPDFSESGYFKINGLDRAGLSSALGHYLTRGRAEGMRTVRVAQVPNNLFAPEGEAWSEVFEAHLSRRSKGEPGSFVPLSGEDGPLFTVLTCAATGSGKGLERLAVNLADQTCAAFEWLVRAPGSTSPTQTLLNRLAEREPRLRLVPAGEQTEGLDSLVALARGRYVVALDPSTVLYPDALALIAAAIADETPDMIVGDATEIDASGMPSRLIHNALVMPGLGVGPASGSLVSIRREVAGALQVYAQRTAGDDRESAAYERVACGERALRHVPEVLTGFQATAERTAARARQAGFGQRDRESRQRLPEAAFCEAAVVIPAEANSVGAAIGHVELVKELCATVRLFCPPQLACKLAALLAEGGLQRAQVIVYEDEDALARGLGAVGPNAFAVFVLSSEVSICSAKSLASSLSWLEKAPFAGAVGGLSLWDGRVVNAGFMVGLEEFLGSPCHGWPEGDVRRRKDLIGRVVDAVPLSALCIRAQALREGCAIDGVDVHDALHGVRLSLALRKAGYRCVLGDLDVEVEHYLPAVPGTGTAAGVRFRRDYEARVARLPFSRYLSRRADAYGSLRLGREIMRDQALQTAEIPPATLLNLEVSADLSRTPTINILLPGLKRGALTGGPNTALNIGYRLAALGFPVRILSTDVPSDTDLEPIHEHILRVSGGTRRLPNLTLGDASDRSRPYPIGANDIFFATAWWTARMAHGARDLVGGEPFIYLIQDFEPIFYPASSSYALAEETYEFPHIPVINTSLLRDYLVQNGIGRFADPDHAGAALCFEPAIDREFFYPDLKPRKRRRLLFYARPTVAVRNMFEIGVSALRAAVARGVLNADEWDIVGMGEQFAPVALGSGARLECAPWLGFDNYARQMRESDILLSLMLSPHPSYPPLEMAGCGGIAVTNRYHNKTSQKLGAISPNIITASPNVPALADALEEAVSRLDQVEDRIAGSELSLPHNWDQSFATMIPGLASRLEAAGVRKDPGGGRPLHEARRLRKPEPAPGSNYARFLAEARARREENNQAAVEPGLLSLVSTVWNTAPSYLEVLADSIRDQAGGTEFEWLILDNGSDRADTREWLDRIAREPFVRLERVEQNLGIIRGMRWCLEHATGRYILPLDSDDFLYDDCLRTLTWYLQRHDYPMLAYTDEDKVVGEELNGAFLKPDFDPLLFSGQCFIAHLCAIDRKRALELDVYGDVATEGSHDWDTFTRFYNAGHVPLHVPEILYGWRIHPQSTAGNIDSKPIVYDSQLAVLERWLAGRDHGDRFEIARNPWFGRTPDWWLRRRRENGRPVVTIVIGSQVPDAQLKLAPGLIHRVYTIGVDAAPGQLAAIVESCRRSGCLVHLISAQAHPLTDDWAWEAIGIFERHPDTVVVGGIVTSQGRICTGGGQLGFSNGFGYPDRARPLDDPGYSAEAWKHRSVGCVSAMHAVFDVEFLAEVLALAEANGGTIRNLGSWAGGLAAETGRRVAYSPILRAETTDDWELAITPAERGRAAARFARQMPEQALFSRHRGLTAATGSIEVSRPWRGLVTLSGVEFPREGLPALLPAVNSGLATAPFRFTLLTTLYIGTDAELFRLTVQSVLGQTCGSFDWQVLAHGPLSPELSDFLEELRQHPAITLHELDENLGIVGGMGYLLDRASGDFIVPLDSDDLLAPDALAQLARAITASETRPAILYTDEYVFAGETIVGRFTRSDWDPVLDLENSWIWHAVAFDRQIACDLGVYSGGEAEYCHDWDTIDRFSAAGHEPVHVESMAYYWRQHASSTSNSGSENAGSMRSVREVLQRKIDRAGLTTEMRIEPFPIWRGASELWIAPAADAVLPSVLAMGPAGLTGVVSAGTTMLAVERNASLRRIGEQVADHSEDIVIVYGASALQPLLLAEAIKLFRFFPQVSAVSGRVVADRIVASAGLRRDTAGKLASPWVGMAPQDPGAMAMALKAQRIAVASPHVLAIRRTCLAEALSRAPEWAVWGDLAAVVAVDAERKGQWIVHAPTLELHTAETVFAVDPNAVAMVMAALAGGKDE